MPCRRPNWKTCKSKVDDQMAKVAEANEAVQDAATYRKELDNIFGEMTAEEVAAKKKLDEQEGKLAQLVKARDERQNNAMKEFTELPIIDAFGRPIKIEQIWLPKLTINYNFGDVALAVRPLHHLPPGDGQDGARLGHRAGLSAATDDHRAIALADARPSDARRAEAGKADRARASSKKRYASVLEEVYGLQLAERRTVRRR